MLTRPTVSRSRAWVTVLVAGMATAPAAPSELHAQLLPVGDSWDDYVRVLDAIGIARTGSLTVRPSPIGWTLDGVSDTLPHPWAGRLASPPARALGTEVSLVLSDPGARAFLNTSRPLGPNEGSVWAGRGITTAVDAGASLVWGPVTASFHPTVAFAQNREFELAPVSLGGLPRYAYPWRWIDLPQRFGPDSFWTFDPGQSHLRIRIGGVVAGVGTESLWWGPGLRNGILMSNNAPGFPHALLGTSQPVRIGIGSLEAQWIWGRLDSSDWFDTTFVVPNRYLTGAVVTISPDWLDGLHVGASRVFYRDIPEDGLPFGEHFLVFQGVSKEAFGTPNNPSGEDERSQMFAAFFRWAFPSTAFELWLEWARNDHGWNLRDYFLEPEHASGRTFGLRKVVALSGNRLLSLEAEITSLQRSSTSALRDVPTYYAHHLVLQGYTQRGRVIGASVGPGGSAQYVGISLYAPWGRSALLVQRRVVDNDAYYSRFAADQEWCCHHGFLDLGAEVTAFLGNVELGATGTLSRELNRYFRKNSDHWNLSLRMEARWRPR